MGVVWNIYLNISLCDQLKLYMDSFYDIKDFNFVIVNKIWHFVVFQDLRSGGSAKLIYIEKCI